MANPYRGEIAASLDGASYTLCLTLGALAELETAFGTDDMLSLASRFSGGRISANDCVRIIGAGLRGGGHDIADQAVARMRGAEGASGYISIVARLLAATFGGPVAGPAVDAARAAIDTGEAAATMAKAHEVETVAPDAFLAASPPRPFPGPR
jgi:Phage tail tube protein, GTA-gp10